MQPSKFVSSSYEIAAIQIPHTTVDDKSTLVQVMDYITCANHADPGLYRNMPLLC